MRSAVIDIGTNSVKLLVADLDGASVVPVWEESQQTRLGAGFYETHCLRFEAIQDTARAVARFAGLARARQAIGIRVFATSAARDATNQLELVAAVQQASGLAPEIISGEQEADWAFAGVRSDPALANRSLLIMDVGGGSTEFIVGHGARQVFRQSFPIGSVRLLERMPPADPPRIADWDQCWSALSAFLAAQVEPVLEPHVRSPQSTGLTLVGTGGTASMLAAMQLGLKSFDREQIEKTVLSAAMVEALRVRLWSLALRQRRELPGLPANRADVILFGVAIFECAMRAFGLMRLHVSTRGLRFGAVAAASVV